MRETGRKGAKERVAVTETWKVGIETNHENRLEWIRKNLP
jgi:hypothetical protein